MYSYRIPQTIQAHRWAARPSSRHQCALGSGQLPPPGIHHRYIFRNRWTRFGVQISTKGNVHSKSTLLATPFYCESPALLYHKKSNAVWKHHVNQNIPIALRIEYRCRNCTMKYEPVKGWLSGMSAEAAALTQTNTKHNGL